MRKVEAAAFRRMPWKNGGGETAEIAVAPDGGTAEAFDWRVSTAHVASPGPFSLFQGVDRSLVVLFGQGLRLVTRLPSGDQDVLLDPTSAPFCFAGDIPAYAELIGSAPVVDFNVMTRRSTFRHTLRRITTRDVTDIAGDAVVLYCLAGRVGCSADGTSIVLTAGDAGVVGDGGTSVSTSVRIGPCGDGVCDFLAAQFFRE